MGYTNQALEDTLLVVDSLEKPLLTEDDHKNPGADIPAADKTAATTSNTAADAALGDDAPKDVDLTASDASAPERDFAHDDQQGGGTCSSAESTDCGSDGDEDAADGDDDEDNAKNEVKERQREIKRIMRQRRREIGEAKDALRAMEARVATVQLQAQPLPQQDALPEHDLIPLPSTTTDSERAADEVAQWV